MSNEKIPFICERCECAWTSNQERICTNCQLRERLRRNLLRQRAALDREYRRAWRPIFLLAAILVLLAVIPNLVHP